MEGYITNKYAKFIDSRHHSYSEDSLEIIVQLLTMKANKIKLNEKYYVDNSKFNLKDNYKLDYYLTKRV